MKLRWCYCFQCHWFSTVGVSFWLTFIQSFLPHGDSESQGLMSVALVTSVLYFQPVERKWRQCKCFIKYSGQHEFWGCPLERADLMAISGCYGIAPLGNLLPVTTHKASSHLSLLSDAIEGTSTSSGVSGSFPSLSWNTWDNTLK